MERLADPLLQLEIDEWILDYLLFSATKALLEAYERMKDGPSHVSNSCERTNMCFQLTDSFFTTFCAVHPDYHASPDLQFRLRLLKFTAMFTKRSVPLEEPLPGPVLQDLRHRRREQAISFHLGNLEFTALDFSNLTGYINSEYNKPLGNMEVKKVPTTHGSSSEKRRSKNRELFQPTVSLLDTIPLFMAMSAAQMVIQEGTITEAWMRLAANFMTHAVAEQFLVYGSGYQEALQEAFSWGFDPECNAEEGTDEFQINAMFWGVDAVVDGWDRIRDEHVRALIPPVGVDLQVHMEILMSKDFSIAEFERRLVDFLDKMLMGQSKPLLLQIESGKIDGLTRKDIKALFEAIGIA